MSDYKEVIPSHQVPASYSIKGGFNCLPHRIIVKVQNKIETYMPHAWHIVKIQSLVGTLYAIISLTIPLLTKLKVESW